jgi:hypothetical protein
MNFRKRLLFLLIIFACLIFNARVARACSCGPTPTVLDAYEHADVVVIVRVMAVEMAADESARNAGYGRVVSTKMVVEKVFKGNLKAGDEMTFAQGGGADCIWTFEEKDIGRQYLLYPFQVSKKNPQRWVAGGCGRGNSLEDATEDLLYLNNLDKLRGKTRISGRLGFEAETALGVEGRKIRIIGPKKTYEVKTDAHGVYEIYDLPAGEYLIEPEVPFGWKVDAFFLGYSPSFAGSPEDKPLKGKIPILLEDKRHASLNILFEIDNAIRGHVFDPDGKPMKDVCVKALPAEGGEAGFLLGCTDPNGRFSIGEIPSGSYILAINEDGKINSDEPFGTFYYPNVAEREKAAVITISEGVFREDINVYVPKVEETVTIEGVFLYSDGKPIVDESIEFKSDSAKEGVEGDAREQTDAKGRFSIKVLKGLKGHLYGAMYAYIGEFENCPKLEAAIKKLGTNTSAEIKTPAVQINADNNIGNIELRYPFPGCKKAKSD